ncbi:hypothetical protein [Kitasatospora sp. P5_F3]
MYRRISAKRATVLAVAVLAVAGALSIPASASDAPAPASGGHRVIVLPSVSLEFSGPAGVRTTGSGIVKDTDGNAIGTVFQRCNALNTAAGKTYCTGLIVEDSGSQVTYAAAVPNGNTFPTAFTSVLTGGVGNYEGATGQANFTTRSQGVEDLSFQ